MCPGASKKSLQECLPKLDRFDGHSGTLKSGENIVNSNKKTSFQRYPKVSLLGFIWGDFWEPEAPLYTFWGGMGTIFGGSFSDAAFFAHIAEKGLQNRKKGRPQKRVLLEPFFKRRPRCSHTPSKARKMISPTCVFREFVVYFRMFLALAH